MNQEDKHIQKQLEKVTHIDKKERKEETLNEALVNRLKEFREAEGNESKKSGMRRTVSIPIPSQLVKENEDVRAFIKKAGDISRREEFHLPIVLENEAVKSGTGETINLLMVQAEYQSETDIEAIEAFLEN